MLSEIRIKNRKGVAVIDIEGVIGTPESMQFESHEQKIATYAKFTEALSKISAISAEEIVVNIRSTGGDVNDAIQIYEALVDLDRNITTRCYGYVASAATIIAQAASSGRREISANTLYLIHCSESAAEGNSSSLARTKDLLDKTDRRISAIYAERSGVDPGAFIKLMNENSGKGRWLTAQETVEYGLADKVISKPRVSNEAVADANTKLAMQIIQMFGLPDPEPKVKTDDVMQNEEIPEKPEPGRVVRWIMRIIHMINPDKGNITLPADKADEPVVDVRTVVFERRTAQDTAKRTAVKEVEDPSMGEYAKSQNQLAYEEDVMSIRGY